MELILTGASTTALQLERLGVVNKAVSSEEDVLEVAMKSARTIASFSAPAVGLAKQAVVAGKFLLDLANVFTKLTDHS